MELAVVEKINQDLPLNADEMAYLINFFNLESLNRFCSTSWYARNFCSESQVWRKKFRRHLLLDIRPGSQLSIITEKQWLHYWDYLANGRCPNQYRLLVAFLTLFHSGVIIELINNTGDISFNLDTIFGPDQLVEEEYDAHIPIEEGIGLLTPFVANVSVTIDGQDAYHDHKDILEVVEIIEELGWYSELEDEDIPPEDQPLDISIPSNSSRDAVTIIYNFLDLGYKMVDFDFRRVVAQIGACAACATPKPKTICGACGAVPYCGQKCANAHWEKHNCTK
jgi:hypothetical protein